MTQISTDPELPGQVVVIPLEDPTEHVIVPTKRRVRLRDLPREWQVIAVLAARNFKLKYQQSLLGPLWLVVQPAALLVAFLVAFKGLGNVSSAGQPYVVFTLVGLSVWSYFQAAMSIGTAAVISNTQFVRYTPCPRPAFPLAALIASLPSFAVVAVAAVGGAVFTGSLSPRVVLLPLGLIWLCVLTAGIVGIASALAVRYRDIISVVPLILQIGVFVTPVGYALSSLSSTARHLVELNPLAGLIEAFRWMVLSGYSPEVGAILISVVFTAGLAVAGWMVFTRFEPTMADEI